ncbi:MAG: 4Fe-4S binding protein, partial [Candidatus Dadabacteria bacterium]
MQAAAVGWAVWIALNAAFLAALADQTRTPPPWLAALARWFPFGPEAGSLTLEDYCPFGPLEGAVRAVQGLWAGRGLSFVGPVTLRNLGVLAAVVALVLLTKRTFCGWLCPFGALFDLLEWLGRRLGL